MQKRAHSTYKITDVVKGFVHCYNCNGKYKYFYVTSKSCEFQKHKKIVLFLLLPNKQGQRTLAQGSSPKKPFGDAHEFFDEPIAFGVAVVGKKNGAVGVLAPWHKEQDVLVFRLLLDARGFLFDTPDRHISRRVPCASPYLPMMARIAICVFWIRPFPFRDERVLLPHGHGGRGREREKRRRGKGASLTRAVFLQILFKYCAFYGTFPPFLHFCNFFRHFCSFC